MLLASLLLLSSYHGIFCVNFISEPRFTNTELQLRYTAQQILYVTNVQRSLLEIIVSGKSISHGPMSSYVMSAISACVGT